jgi:hypothetical protein
MTTLRNTRPRNLRLEFDAEIQGTRLHVQEVKMLIETTRLELKTQLAEVETPVWRRDSWKVGTRVVPWPLEAAKTAARMPATCKSSLLRGPIRRISYK